MNVGKARRLRISDRVGLVYFTSGLVPCQLFGFVICFVIALPFLTSYAMILSALGQKLGSAAGSAGHLLHPGGAREQTNKSNH